MVVWSVLALGKPQKHMFGFSCLREPGMPGPAGRRRPSAWRSCRRSWTSWSPTSATCQLSSPARRAQAGTPRATPMALQRGQRPQLTALPGRRPMVTAGRGWLRPLARCRWWTQTTVAGQASAQSSCVFGGHLADLLHSRTSFGRKSPMSLEGSCTSLVRGAFTSWALFARGAAIAVQLLLWPY